MDDEDWQERWDEEHDFFRTRSEYGDDTTLEGAMNYHLYVLNSPLRSNPDTGADSLDVLTIKPAGVRSEGQKSDINSKQHSSHEGISNPELGKRNDSGSREELVFTKLDTTQIAKGTSGSNPATIKPVKKSKPTELQADIDLDDVDFGNVKFLSGQELIDFYRTHKVYSAYPELLDPTLNDKDRKKLGHDIRKRISAQDIRNKKRNRMDELEKKLKEYEAQEKLAYQEEIRLLKERNQQLENLLKSALGGGLPNL